MGVLDIDLTGPNIPHMFRVADEGRITQGPEGWLPVTIHDADPTRGLGKLRIMSLGFLVRRGDSVVWRGPKKTAMIKQFITDVAWGETDYLLIDTPPGTSDEHISVVEYLLQYAQQDQMAGAVMVTTPQAVAGADVRKELDFCRKTRLRVIGIVENMSGFVCPNCSECSYLFSKGGGQVLAQDFSVEFLGSVPVDPQFSVMIDQGRRPVYPEGTIVLGQELSSPPAGDQQTNGEAVAEPLVAIYQHCSLCPIYKTIAATVMKTVEGAKT